MRKSVLISFLISIILLASCNSRPSVTTKSTPSKNLPVISIIADSKQALALFQQQEKNIEKNMAFV
jgi:PII-like signaling protein